MKKITAYLFLSLLVMACSKSTGSSAKLEGRWKLTAMFIQTSGAGSWFDHDSIPPDFIQFNHDGTLVMSDYVSSLYGAPIGYKVTGNTQFVFHYAPRTDNTYLDSVTTYQLNDSILTITPQTMEYVVEKYVRVHTAP
jgi:hypothetical protein